MKNKWLLLGLCCISLPTLAQMMPDSSQQYMLIVRYRRDMKVPATDILQKNGQHWGIFLNQLSQSNKLVTAFRPENGGTTISGGNQEQEKQPYRGGGETVSSIIIIRAATQEEAAAIAKKCPIFEMDGSVEIRSIQHSQKTAPDR